LADRHGLNFTGEFRKERPKCDTPSRARSDRHVTLTFLGDNNTKDSNKASKLLGTWSRKESTMALMLTLAWHSPKGRSTFAVRLANGIRSLILFIYIFKRTFEKRASCTLFFKLFQKGRKKL
jgi:2'-5' RNA ligase